MLRVIVAIGGRPGADEMRMLQLIQYVPTSLAASAESVQTVFRDYKELMLSRQGLKQLYILTLTLTLLLALFAALALAFILSRRLSAPLATLAQATEAVARGDFTRRAEATSADELGTLARSFNSMTAQLDEARNAAERGRRAVETAKAHLESVLASVTTGVLVLDRDFRLQIANAAAARILGFEPADREFERLGGTEPIKVNVRLIAATNKDMEQAIAQGTFREDLFYRLNVFSIFIPPLRERKPDVLLLADHFLERFASEHGKDIRRISTPAIDMLTAYHWPGNARELQNVIERAVLVCDGHVIHAHHLPPTLQTAEASGTVMSVSLEDAMDAYEKDLLQDSLKSARGNRAKAARLLRTTDRIFNYKVRKLGIDWKRFKP